MKIKRKILLGLMVASLLGGVGGALALTRNGATVTGGDSNYDAAIHLNWETDSTAASATLNDLDDISAGTAQYNYLTVAPKSTKNVAGTVTVTFTLASGGANTHMEGLTVSVYATASLATDLTVASLIDGVTPTPVLTKNNLTGSTTFAVSTNSTAHTTTKYYAIKVLWDGSNDSSHPTYELGASVSIHLSFAA